MKEHQIDSIREAAIELEKTNIEMAYDLMLIAKENRPHGPLIKSKLSSYSTQLEEKKLRGQLVLKKIESLIIKKKEQKHKTIWMYWDSGLDNAPDLVKTAYKSWIKMNPDWNVVLLTDKELLKLIGFDFNLVFDAFPMLKLGKAGKSDLLRLYLLYRFGGVWADATTFCLKPLSSWLDISENGFFCFRQEKNCVDRQMVSWFLASLQGGEIIKDLLLKSLSFLSTVRKEKISIGNWNKSEVPKNLIGREKTGYDFLFFMEKKCTLPYFWMFYIFNEVIKNHKEKWNKINKMPNNHVQLSNMGERFIDAYVSKQTYKPLLMKKSTLETRIKISNEYASITDYLSYPKNWMNLQKNAQISEENKTIFVHLPKCGGTSIDNSNLFSYQRSGHHSYKYLRKLIGKRGDEFKTLVLTRNPWDRLASAFYYLSEGGGNPNDKKVSEIYFKKYKGNFKLFLIDFIREPNFFIGLTHLKPMIDYVNPNEIDTKKLIYKLENIKNIDPINDFLGFNLKINHERKRKSYSNIEKIYDKNMFDAIKKIYNDDVLAFGYDSYNIDDIKN